MKIIKEGKPEKKEKPIFKKCKKCNCEFEFTYGETKVFGDPFKLYDYINCPWCGDMIML